MRAKATSPLATATIQAKLLLDSLELASNNLSGERAKSVRAAAFKIRLLVSELLLSEQ